MKIKVFDRVLAAILALVLIAIGVIGILMAANVINLETVTFCANALYHFWQVQVIVIAVCAVVIILALRILLMHQKREPEEKSILLRTTSNGTIRISLFTIDSLAQKHTRSISYVRDVKSKVTVVENGVKISLNLSLMPETNIPELTTSLQSTVKEYVETYSGVFVQEVTVFVDDTSLNLSSRTK